MFKSSILISSGDDGTINMTANSSIVKPSPASDLSNSQGKYESGDLYIYVMFCWRFVYFFNVVIFLLRLILKFASVC